MTCTEERTDTSAVTTDGEAPDIIGYVRRALAASAAELERAVAELRPDDRRRQRALDRWFAGFASQLRRHHDLVDTMVVPALSRRGALDQRSLDSMSADHAWLDQLIGDLGDALGVLSFGLGDERTWIRTAVDLAMALRHAVDGQLGREQRLLSALVGRHFTLDEQDVLRYESMRLVAGGPVRFSLAWLYSHVDPLERSAISAFAPTTHRLIWRPQRRAYQRSTVAALG